jgi:hypothetical protein
LEVAEGDKLKLVILSKMFFSKDFAFFKSERESPLSTEVFELRRKREYMALVKISGTIQTFGEIW